MPTEFFPLRARPTEHRIRAIEEALTGLTGDLSRFLSPSSAQRQGQATNSEAGRGQARFVGIDTGTEGHALFDHLDVDESVGDPSDGDLLFFDEDIDLWVNGRTLPQPITIDVDPEPASLFTLKVAGVTRLDFTGEGRIRQVEQFEIRSQSGTEDSGSGGRKMIFKDLEQDLDRMELLYNGELRVTLNHTNHPDDGISHALQLFRRTSGTPAVGFGTGIQHFMAVDGGDVEFAGGTRVFWTNATSGSESASIELMYVDTGVAKVGVRCTGDNRVLMLDSLRFDIPKQPPASASQAQIQQGAGGFTGGAGGFAGASAGTGVGQNWSAGGGADFLHGQIAGTTSYRMTSAGFLALGGTSSPTAALHLPAGTATANTAPLKLTSGTNLGTPEAGVVEYDGTLLTFTPGATRRTVYLLPATPADYTVANHTEDRSLDETGDTLAQVANVLGTLILDLISEGILQ